MSVPGVEFSAYIPVLLLNRTAPVSAGSAPKERDARPEPAVPFTVKPSTLTFPEVEAMASVVVPLWVMLAVLAEKVRSDASVGAVAMTTDPVPVVAAQEVVPAL